MFRLKSYAPAAILFAGCALLWYARTQEAMALVGPLDGVLGDIQGYEVTQQEISKEERRVAGMTEYSARAYSRDGALAFTTLVSYYARQTHGKTIHSPRNCLPGAGWEVVEAATRDVQVDGVTRTINRYVLRNGSETALAYYWYQGRGRVTASEYTVKWNLLRDAALLGHTEEALLRVVVPVNGAPGTNQRDSLMKADAVAQDIAARLVRDVERVLPATRGV